MRFGYADESDRVRYPIPRGVHIEGGRDADGDRHALLLDRGALPALRAVRPQGRPGAWSAGSGATWNLRSTAGPPGRLDLAPTRPACRSCRCSPATRRCSRGRIDHALRVTVRRSRRAYVYPARHFASDDPTRRCRGWASGCG